MEAPLPSYDADDQAFAQEMKATFGEPRIPSEVEDRKVKRQLDELTDGGRRPINDFVVPYVPSSRMAQGSTDVGDVSWLTPTAQFTTATWPSGSPGHSWQNVACGKTSISHKGLIYAAKVLAGAAADLMSEPQLLIDAKEEFSIAAAEGYDCPIGPDLIPLPQ